MDKRQQAIEFLMTIREGALLDEIYDTCVEATVAAVDRIQAIVSGTGESVLRGTWNG